MAPRPPAAPSPSSAATLDAVGEIITVLSDASLFLARAARWADRDRSLSPLNLLGGPMKYVTWYRAKRRVAAAATLISALRAHIGDTIDLPEVELELSAVDAINDLFDLFPFSVRRVGTPGGPSRLTQRLGVETNVYNQIETSRLGVDHLLSEVGLLHARLRTGRGAGQTAPAGPAAPAE